jgi:hypothetical protein
MQHDSEFMSVMTDLEYLGYDINTIVPNSRYSLKDIILHLTTEYQLVGYENGLADGHADGYDLGTEEGQYEHSRGYEEGYDAGEEDAGAVNQDEAYERGFDDGVYETRHGVDH